MKRHPFLGLFVLSCFFPLNLLLAKEFYISPLGDDKNPGTHERPFASLTTARDAARKVGVQELRTIVMTEGRYYQNEPLVLTPLDNGLTIRAASGTRPVIYGGKRIAHWQPDGDRFYAAALPEDRRGEWDFRVLVVNDRYCHRSRLPRVGRFQHLSRFDVPWVTSQDSDTGMPLGFARKPTLEEVGSMKYDPQDVGPWLDVNNAELSVYSMWESSLLGLKRNDTTENRLWFANRAGFPMGAFSNSTYNLWNVRKGITHPGQWMLDRTSGKVVYWPRPGEEMNQVLAVAPTTESIFRVEGSREHPVRNLTIKGLKLFCTNAVLELADLQGEIGHYDGGDRIGRPAGAIDGTHLDGCRFENLEIAHVGGQGIKATGINNSHVNACHIHHTGSAGATLTGKNTTIADNTIHDVGMIFVAISALRIRGDGLVAIHNDFRDCPYTAIHGAGDNHRIARNRIQDVLQVLWDGAGIYVTFCRGIKIQDNFITDIPIDESMMRIPHPYPYFHSGSHAIYLDEKAYECVVEGNVALWCPSVLQFHQAADNSVRNNVFIHDGHLMVHQPYSKNFTFEKNVFYALGAILFGSPEADTVFRDNILYSGAGQIQGYTVEKYYVTEASPIDLTQGNRTDDPLLAHYKHGKVDFGPGSFTGSLGIAAVDVSDAGPRHVR